MLVERPLYEAQIHRLFDATPIVAILGPRQCGKTTLSKQFATQYEGPVHRFDLEDIRDLAKLENPYLTLEPLKGLIIMDEVQLQPDMFSHLRVIIDNDPEKQFLLLGSASRDLVSHSSETLAGRISYLELKAFSLAEVMPLSAFDWRQRWLRGGFPGACLAVSDSAAWIWRQNYIRTFLERDLPTLGISIPAMVMRQFWTMVSHYHSQTVNYTELGKSLGVSDTTAKKYLAILEGTFMIRRLQPYHINTKKRMLKQPKLYLRDSGLFHSLQTIETYQALLGSPKLGASWEGFAIEQVYHDLQLEPDQCFFWGVHSGAECDLVFVKNGRVWGIEFKYMDAPKMTRSMHACLADLNLAHLAVIYPGDDHYHLDDKVSVWPLSKLAELRKILN